MTKEGYASGYALMHREALEQFEAEKPDFGHPGLDAAWTRWFRVAKEIRAIKSYTTIMLVPRIKEFDISG